MSHQEAQQSLYPSMQEEPNPSAPLLVEASVKPARNTVLTIALAPMAVALPTLVVLKACDDQDLNYVCRAFSRGEFVSRVFEHAKQHGTTFIAPALLKSSLAFGASAAALYALHTGQFSSLDFTSTDNVFPRMVVNPRLQRMLKHASIMTGIYVLGTWVPFPDEPTDNPIYIGAVVIVGAILSATFIKSAFELSVELLF